MPNADDTTADYFGVSVSLSDHKALVGAYYDDDKGSASGSAYVFERQGDGSWKQTAKLLAADGAASDSFGTSVSLSGDKALVGAPYIDSGSAYVFERQGDSDWSQAAKLLAGGEFGGYLLGSTVSLSGQSMSVGAKILEPNTTNGSGAVFVFDVAAACNDGKCICKPGFTGPDCSSQAGGP